MAQRILKALDYGGLLDETFDLYKNNFLLLTGIAALVLVPICLLRFIGDPESTFASLMSLLYIPAGSIIGAATTNAVSRRYLGQNVTILSSFNFMKGRFWLYAGTMILTSVIVLIGFLLLVVPGIFFSLWYAFVSQVFVLEGLSNSAARERSKTLVKYDIGKLFSVNLFTGIIIFIIRLIFKYAINLIPGISDSIPESANILSDLLTTPIYITVIVLLYYDMRVRYEGFDIEMLAANMGSSKSEINESDTALRS